MPFKNWPLSSVAAAGLMLAGCAHSSPPPSASAPAQTDNSQGQEASAKELVLSPSSERPSVQGDAANFTGEATITPLFKTTEYTRAMGASVTFQPGAHTAWHSHPAGQTLIISSGTGWVQAFGQERVEVHAGDVLWTPPGVKHWHGATPNGSMSHLAIQEAVDGEVVHWQEHVSDEQYQGESN